MADSPLDPFELDAIKAAIQQATSSKERPEQGPEEDAIPLALIADDRAAEGSRPTALRIGDRWARRILTKTRHLVRFGASVVGADIIDGKGLQDELDGSWLCAAVPKQHPGSALIAVNGPVIEGVASRLLGGHEDAIHVDDADDRAPSATSLEVFHRAGKPLIAALADAWRDEQGCDVAVVDDAEAVEETRSAICGSDLVIALTLEVSTPARGWLRLFARPTTLVAPPAPLEAIPAAPGALEEALGNVDVEVSVDFGHASVTMRELASLRVGTIIPLLQFTDDPLPVECAGVVKASGRAVVYRGVLSVEVCVPHSQTRSKAA